MTRARPVVLGYSTAELARLAAARGSLDDTDRRVFDAHWLLGLGVGATKVEALLASPSQVAERDGLVVVHLSGRAVAVDRRYTNDLVAFAGRHSELATLAGSRRHGSDRMRGLVSTTSGVRFDPARLRDSWVSARLADGVPLDVLTDAAGASISKLNELCGELRPRSMAEQLAWHAHLLEVDPPLG